MPRPDTRQRPALLGLAQGSLLLCAMLLAGCAAMPGDREPVGKPTLDEARAAFLRQDYGTAARLLEPLAIGGLPRAQYALGYLYFYGRGLPRSERKAMAWFDEAARMGDPKARRALEMLRAQQRQESTAGGPDLNPQRPAGAAAPRTPEPGRRSEPPPSGSPEKNTPVADTPPSTYTVQLLGSRSLKDLERLATRHGLMDASRYYQAGSKERPWYRLLYGRYPTVSEARAVLRALPSTLKKHEPWVRDYPDVPPASVRRFRSVLAGRS